MLNTAAVLVGILFAATCLAAAAGELSQGGAAKEAGYPNITFRQEDGGTRVHCDGQLLLELRGNRFLRFRATPLDENWVGSEKSPADLGWTYRDEGTKGMVVLGASDETDPARGIFVLKVQGKKPQFESRIDVTLTGTWMPQAGKFKYLLDTRLQCPLEEWYAHTKFRQRGNVGLWTEVIDYCIEGVSIPERLMSPSVESRGKPHKYPWFVKSPDGEKWQKWPKVHVPYPIRRGSYITIRDLAHPCTTGGYYGFLDADRGGWMTRILKSPCPVSYELCWARFDVHTQLEGAIPPRGSAKNLSLQFTLEFEPVEGARAAQIVAAADELPWRDAREYKLPLFAPLSRFDKLITDLPGERTGDHMLWWPSSYDCWRDDTTGVDDNCSVTIKRKDASAPSSGWTTLCWGYPFTPQRKWGRRFRLSAMVKTAACTGSVRLGVYGSVENIGDMYYGRRQTHHRDGTPRTQGMVWQYSKPLSGTADWTPLSLEFTVKHFSSTLLLEHTGTGQCWFDNVKIEDLGPVRPEKAKS